MLYYAIIPCDIDGRPETWSTDNMAPKTRGSLKNYSEMILKKIKTSSIQYPLSKILLDASKPTLEFFFSQDSDSDACNTHFTILESEDVIYYLEGLSPPSQYIFVPQFF